MSFMTRRGSFYAFVTMVFGAFAFFAAPVPMLFLAFNGFVLLGLFRHFGRRRRARAASATMIERDLEESLRP